MPRLIAALVAGLAATAPAASAKEDRLFEMRVYYAAPGKLDALHARFRDHTVKLFEKHGMTNVGYWVPLDNPERKLIYLLAHKDKAAADASWKAFGADPAWTKARTESEKDGRLVAKVERFWMTATDYSPPVRASAAGKDRVFELRTYTASPNNLDHLHARFRDHTVKLFEKHGMTNVAYWALAPGLKQKGEVATLIYILAHDSPEAGKKSFDAFRDDPAWLTAKGESEQKAGGSLTAKDGVKSVYMKATDYSPMK